MLPIDKTNNRPGEILADSYALDEEILELLADVWNKFIKLTELHPSDGQEFMHIVHMGQNMIMARYCLIKRMNDK